MVNPSTSTQRLSGGCLCGAVRYRVDDTFEYAMNCHCSQCRRATGSAFKSFAGIGRENFSVVEGAEKLFRYGDDVTHDARCSVCGSFLYSQVREGQFVHVLLGTLHDVPSIRPSAHIFVTSKAPWYTIADDLPQYDEFA